MISPLTLTVCRAQELAPLLPVTCLPQKTVAVTEIPDAPTPSSAPEGQQSSSASPSWSSAQTNAAIPEEDRQTKRILWIVPNFRAVSAGQKLPPQSVKEKFKTAALEEASSHFRVRSSSGIQAGISQWTDSYPEFHQGLEGYGRYYWHTFRRSDR